MILCDTEDLFSLSTIQLFGGGEWEPLFEEKI